jgi:GNAT superfamily N-acetyltransferase
VSIEIRVVGPGPDAQQAAALLSAVLPEPLSRERMEAALHAPAQAVWLRAAVDPAAGPVACGLARPQPAMGPQLRLLALVTRPEHRRRGAGSALVADALDWARRNGVAELIARVRDDDAESLRFAERHGFRIDRHTYEWILDLAGFDESPFTGTVAQAERSGIHFLTLADAGDSPAARQRVFELNRETAQDIPGRAGFFTFEQYCRHRFEGPAYRPEGVLLTADGAAWVGLTFVTFPPGGAAVNEMTGVLRAYRGRKIAQALKVLAVRAARAGGAAAIRESNDAENAAMLAINRKMGYRREPGYYSVRRTIG